MIQDLMSGGAAVEDTLELWASSRRDVKGRIPPLFTQDRVAASASDFLDALLSNVPRARLDGCALRARVIRAPWRQQVLLGRGRWDAEALRDIVRDLCLQPSLRWLR